MASRSRKRSGFLVLVTLAALMTGSLVVGIGGCGGEAGYDLARTATCDSLAMRYELTKVLVQIGDAEGARAQWDTLQSSPDPPDPPIPQSQSPDLGPFQGGRSETATLAES
jgi:hypothetical protein